MNRIHIVLCLIMTIYTNIFGQSPIDKSENQIEKAIRWASITEEKYEIKYPSNWDANQSGQMGTSFILLSPLTNESDNFKENVNLLIQDLAGYDLNLDQFVEVSEAQIKNMVTEGKIILSERKHKNDKKYQKVIYTGKQGIFSLKFEQYYWVIENQAFILTFTCKEDEFEKFQKTGEKILNSFKIK